MKFKWDSAQYLQFEKERNQALLDLIMQVKQKRKANSVTSILDIGCGPANSTKMLAKHFRYAEILGIDNSQNMLNQASKNAMSKRIHFKLLCANTQLHTLNEKFDIILANASIHWIQDQHKLFNIVFNLLKKNGIFAVQIPLDSDSLFHQTLQNFVTTTKWQSYFVTNPRIFFSLDSTTYFDILTSYTYDIRMWETTYFHNLANIESIIAWYKGSGLRPYLQNLSETNRILFENELLELLQRVYTLQQNGSVVLQVPRLFFIAVL